MTDYEWDILADARFVVERARHLRLDEAAIDRVGAEFATRQVPVPAWNAELHFTDGTPRTANYLLLLDGLNFSFWGDPRWGIEYQGRKLRGYWALAAALKRAIEEGIAVDDATVMANFTAEELAHVLRGTGEIPLFYTRLRHMNDIGKHLLDSYGGQFTQAIESCQRSARALVKLLATEFPFWDASPYEGRTIHLFKRAQILPADLWGAFGGTGWGAFDDIDALTAFADYKVPQVLVKLGLLHYAPTLEATIRAEQVIAHGTEEEVEIRAATIWGSELLRQAMARHGREVKAVEVDWVLWEMGLHVTEADMPYHLTRTTAY